MNSESGSTQSSNASSHSPDDSGNNSATTHQSYTHRSDIADCHLKNLHSLLDDFKSAAKSLLISSQSGHKYTSLYALLLSWEGDDLGVDGEVKELGTVLDEQYGFVVETWKIPIEKSTSKLTKCIVEWTEEYEGEDKLLLMYYAGHGRIDSTSREAFWANRRDQREPYAELRSSHCEAILHESVSDTLFLLDCCQAGSSISQDSNHFSETIAASGFDSFAPAPGPHSFTTALTRTLSSLSATSKPFRVAKLHTEVVAYLKSLPPGQVSEDGLKLATSSTPTKEMDYEWRTTPVHYIHSTHENFDSIILAPITETTETAETRSISPDQNNHSKSTMKPRVVLSITLAKDAPAANYESCARWLSNFPLPVDEVEVEGGYMVEGVFQSFSTVVLVSIPLEVWDVLPEIPGCNFVCYSQSRNLLCIPPVSNSAQWGFKLPEPDLAWHGALRPFDWERIFDYEYNEYDSILRHRNDEFDPEIRLYYYIFKKFLQSITKENRVNRERLSGHADRLQHWSAISLIDLCTDVLDELFRREGQGQSSSEDAPFLSSEMERHIYRADARRELVKLDPETFAILGGEIYLELERRFLSMNLGDIPKVSLSE